MANWTDQISFWEGDCVSAIHGTIRLFLDLQGLFFNYAQFLTESVLCQMKSVYILNLYILPRVLYYLSFTLKSYMFCLHLSEIIL
jgi:hypothetical protein